MQNYNENVNPNMDYGNPYENYNAPTFFKNEGQENLIRWQLDIHEELERIEHLLRKHIPKSDKKGKIIFVEPPKEEQLFNETGINEILNLLAWYLNKNILLSNFKEEEIKMRCMQFHTQLTDFIFNNYQKFGLNTKEKIKHFPMVVMNMTNTIEASYNRALNGGERTSLRTARSVVQNEPIGSFGGQGMMGNPYQQQKKFSLFKPTTWKK
jgi:hypothetical protein